MSGPYTAGEVDLRITEPPIVDHSFCGDKAIRLRLHDTIIQINRLIFCIFQHFCKKMERDKLVNSTVVRQHIDKHQTYDKKRFQ